MPHQVSLRVRLRVRLRVSEVCSEAVAAPPTGHVRPVPLPAKRPQSLAKSPAAPQSSGHPSPVTRHPSPFTLHPSPFTLHPSPYTLHPSPFTLHPSPFTLHPSPFTLHPSPFTLLREQLLAVAQQKHGLRPSELLLNVSHTHGGPMVSAKTVADWGADPVWGDRADESSPADTGWYPAGTESCRTGGS